MSWQDPRAVDTARAACSGYRHRKPFAAQTLARHRSLASSI